jgi:hypothetical protein
MAQVKLFQHLLVKGPTEKVFHDFVDGGLNNGLTDAGGRVQDAESFGPLQQQFLVD